MENILIMTKIIEDCEEDGRYNLEEIGIDDETIQGESVLIAILEDAYGQDKAGVVIGVKDKDEVVSMIISEDNFREIQRQFKLAMQRFFELRTKRFSNLN